MIKDLCIKVYPSGGFEFKPLLERHIRVDNELSIPFNSLIDNFRFLFGDTCIITFNYF